MYITEIGQFEKTCKRIHEIVRKNSINLYDKCLHVQPHGLVSRRTSNNPEDVEMLRYRDGEIHGKCMKRDGNFTTIANFRHGTTHGSFKIYFNKQLIMKKRYKNGKIHGVQFRYYITGEIKEINHYREGVEHGTHISKFLDGSEQNYRNYEMGKLHGKFILRDDNRVVIRNEIYNNGTLVIDLLDV